MEPHLDHKSAWLRAYQYGGGPDESNITGYRMGYLALGMAILKGASSPADSKGSLPIDYRELFGEDSDVYFHNFELRDDARRTPATVAKPNPFLDALVPIGCILLFGFVFMAFFLGLGEMIKLAFGL